MRQMHYKPNDWFMPVILQADWRIALVLLRSGARGWTLPPGFVRRVVILIFCAASLRLNGPFAIDWHPISALTALQAAILELVVWIGFLIATVLAAWPAVRANRRRAREGTETEHGASWYFRGWPRLMNLRAFDQASHIERQHMWWWSIVVYEPTAGLVAAALLGIVSPSLGLYVALNVLWLWKESIDSTRAATLERRKFQEAVLDRAHLERLVEEVDSRHRRHSPRDGRARLT